MDDYTALMPSGVNVTITNCTVEGILIPDFDSRRPVGQRWHCIPCDVYGDGKGFTISHSTGDHDDPDPAPSGRRAGRRPRSVWLTLWALGHRTRTALAGYLRRPRFDARDVLGVIACIAGGLAVGALFAWLQHVGIL
jgi:hypothetical protein